MESWEVQPAYRAMAMQATQGARGTGWESRVEETGFWLGSGK